MFLTLVIIDEMPHIYNSGIKNRFYNKYLLSWVNSALVKTECAKEIT